MLGIRGLDHKLERLTGFPHLEFLVQGHFVHLRIQTLNENRRVGTTR